MAARGGAVVGLWCNSGMHRSVGVGVIIHHCMQLVGWPVELRHFGNRATADCRCDEGDSRTHCPACEARVYPNQSLGRGPSPSRSQSLYRDHLRLRREALHLACGPFWDAWAAAQLPMVAPAP